MCRIIRIINGQTKDEWILKEAALSKSPNVRLLTVRCSVIPKPVIINRIITINNNQLT